MNLQIILPIRTPLWKIPIWAIRFFCEIVEHHWVFCKTIGKQIFRLNLLLTETLREEIKDYEPPGQVLSQSLTIVTKMVFPSWLMKRLQQSSLVTLHQKLSFPTGHILVDFVDHDHDRNHWSIHRQLCPHLPLSARWYAHRGTVRLYRPWGHNHLSLSHPSTIDPRQLTITLARIHHPVDVHGQQLMKAIWFDLHRYRPHWSHQIRQTRCGLVLQP